MKNVLAAVLFLWALPLPGQTAVDRIVAVVDKEVITESELREQVNLVALQNSLDPAKPELRRQVLDAMINDKLILAQAVLDSIVVSDNEVTQALDQQIQNLVRQAGSEERLERYYGMPMSRIRREFRDEMRNVLLTDRVRRGREGSIRVSLREVEEFYEAFQDSLPQVPEEVELSNIFLVPKPDSTVEKQTRALLQAIRDSIRNGGDFADFARRYSKHSTAANGGDLPPAKRGELLREFEEVAFRLRGQEVSEVFKTDLGLHLIQLIERLGESVRVRQILLPLEKGEASDSAAVERLRELQGRALKGESFADLARQFSEDEQTKALGGNLGRVALEQLESSFRQVVEGLKEGEVSAPHRVNVGPTYGYQIVWLRKRFSPHAMNLKDDFRRIEQLALLYKKNNEHMKWLQELRKNIYWEIRL